MTIQIKIENLDTRPEAIVEVRTETGSLHGAQRGPDAVLQPPQSDRVGLGPGESMTVSVYAGRRIIIGEQFG